MDKEPSIMLMVTSTLEIGKITSVMAMVSMKTKKERDMRVIGKMILKADREKKLGQRAQNTKVSIKMERRRDMGNTHGLTDLNMMGSGLTTK